MRARGRNGKAGDRALEALAGKTLLPLIREDLKVLEVLDRHGVHFCGGCYMTLSATLDRVAAWHAVPDRRRFLRDMKRVLDARKAR